MFAQQNEEPLHICDLELGELLHAGVLEELPELCRPVAIVAGDRPRSTVHGDPCRDVLEDLSKTWAKNRPRIGSKSGVEGCKSRRINNKLD